VSLQIAANVSFLGLRSDVADILWVSDIGILSSHEEGFSNSILEGMAARLPMIVTDVGGNAEAVIDGECGFVVPPHDPGRLAGAIEILARDPALRTAFGIAGRRRIEQRFTLEKCVDAYDALYSGLLAGKMPKDIAAVRLE
jgi:glycosyltransferase involved in cell wall biosynthesis